MAEFQEPPDEALVAQALNGEKEAFGVLAERYYRMISVLAYQRTGHRADAEDIVQEAYVRAFRALATLRDGSKFGAWLYHITLKLCIDWARRRERLNGTLGLDEQALTPAESGRLRRQEAVGQKLEVVEERERILQVIGTLPDRYRLVMTLRYVRKMSYRDIAMHLAEPPGTVANRLHRAMKMVQERLGIRRAEPLGMGPEEEPR